MKTAHPEYPQPHRLYPEKHSERSFRSARCLSTLAGLPPALTTPPPIGYRSPGSMIAANAFRARFSRDFTVPRLHAVISAISS